MQTKTGSESFVCREESKSQFNRERNAIKSSHLNNRLPEPNICEEKTSNECKNCNFVDEFKRESEEKQSQRKTEVISHSFNKEIHCQTKHKTEDNCNQWSQRGLSPIEEHRNEKRDFHAMTSTPTSNKNDLSELNISGISLEESDSEFLCERQMSRFQITDEFINSWLFDDNSKQNE